MPPNNNDSKLYGIHIRKFTVSPSPSPSYLLQHTTHAPTYLVSERKSLCLSLFHNLPPLALAFHKCDNDHTTLGQTVTCTGKEMCH
eukprot:m.19835 g.19835  ORF g.19835 m.19835 type:complete len:86 (-) comp8088_c0_seq1:599-856(-)